MSHPTCAFLHYSTAPVVGGVEAVLQAHARLCLCHGYPVTVIAGEGQESALPKGARLALVPEMSTQHPTILRISAELEQGRIPEEYEPVTQALMAALRPLLAGVEVLVVHNVLSKHFNLPLTDAILRLLDEGALPRTLAWGHDFTWTSSSSGNKVRPGYPWDLLRTYRPELNYVTISEARQSEWVGLLDVNPDTIQVIPNGVDPGELLGLGPESLALVDRLELWQSDLVLLMPVRVTQAKNIEFAMRVVAALKDNGVQAPRCVLTGPPDPHSPNGLDYYHELLALREQLQVQAEFRFVYGEGRQGEEGFFLAADGLSALLRCADLVFLPSHREGFGMPVLEAGLAGVPVAASENVPAGVELGGEDVLSFSAAITPERAARQILTWLDSLPQARWKRRVRRELTWEAIFRSKIEPALVGQDRGENTGRDDFRA